MSIKGLIFDFDGLIQDTETPEFEIWQDVFANYGQVLPLNEWQAALGASYAAFDPVVYLSKKINQPLDVEAIHANQRVRALEQIRHQPARPGISETLALARSMNLKIGIASCSPVNWVFPQLKQLGLFGYFDKIFCSDHVSKIKPDPELYLLCAKELGLTTNEVIVFEDSPNGIRAANAAGIFCVAIPNTLTRQLDISHADLILNRIDEITLEEIFSRATHAKASPENTKKSRIAKPSFVQRFHPSLTGGSRLE